MTEPAILIVDDDPALRDLVALAVRRAGWRARVACDGPSGLASALRDPPDLIVLDVGLPGFDGFELCRRLRGRSEVPILFLTAQSDEVDRVVGLEMGADDYMAKPFSPREMVARIRAILKRTTGQGPAALRHGALQLDAARHACRVGDRDVALTGTEMTILQRLMRRPGALVTRAQVVDVVWGAGSQVADRTLDSHVRNLRAKLRAAGADDAIETVHGLGLRMTDPSVTDG